MTNITVKYHGITYECEGTWVPYVRGCYSGPPEKCYPAEGGYFEDFCATRMVECANSATNPSEPVEDPLLLEELNNEASADYMEDCERDRHDRDEY